MESFSQKIKTCEICGQKLAIDAEEEKWVYHMDGQGRLCKRFAFGLNRLNITVEECRQCESRLESNGPSPEFGFHLNWKGELCDRTLHRSKRQLDKERGKGRPGWDIFWDELF